MPDGRVLGAPVLYVLWGTSFQTQPPRVWWSMKMPWATLCPEIQS